MRVEMAGAGISTVPFASILAHPGKPIFTGGAILTRFAPIRVLFAWGRPKPVRMAIECKAEELLQCMRVEFPTAARGRVRLTRCPPATVENSLQAQFITYQTRNSVQSNGTTSHLVTRGNGHRVFINITEEPTCSHLS